MKKYVILGGIILALIAVAAAAILNNSPEQSVETTSTTTVTSSTTATTIDELDQGESEASNTRDSSQSTSSTEEKKTKSASYQKFSRDAFRSKADTERVLFFYDKDHEPSVALDKLLEAHIADFPDNTAIFKTQYLEEKELAASLSVTSPGTALKYSADNTLAGIYLSNDQPDIVTFRAALDLQDKP